MRRMAAQTTTGAAPARAPLGEMEDSWCEAFRRRHAPSNVGRVPWARRWACFRSAGMRTMGAVSILFDSSHQHRVFAVVRAVEGRRCPPAFRRESRDVGVWDVAEYFRARCVGCRRYAKPLAIDLLRARRRAEPRTRSPQFVTLAALIADLARFSSKMMRSRVSMADCQDLRVIWFVVRSRRPGRDCQSGRMSAPRGSFRAVNSALISREANLYKLARSFFVQRR
jgi:hypothetical protein